MLYFIDNNKGKVYSVGSESLQFVQQIQMCPLISVPKLSHFIRILDSLNVRSSFCFRVRF